MKIAAVNSCDIGNSIEGVAVSIWVQGCPHHCNGCHNPETWDFNKEDCYFEINNLMNETEFWFEIKDKLSANGVKRHLSILGGEPFAPENEIFTFNMIFRMSNEFPDRNIYIWTGYSLEELKKKYIKIPNFKLLKNVSLLITDRFDIKKRDITLPLRGSSNQHIWKPFVKRFLNKEKIYFKDVTKKK